jgi:hypothetical protein
MGLRQFAVRRQAGAILYFLTLSAGAALAQPAPVWPSWGVEDGLTESFTRNVSVDASYTAWLGHGDVNTMSSLDGYQIRNIPALLYNRSRVNAAGGQLWTLSSRETAVSPHGLMEYRHGIWSPHPIGAVTEALKSKTNVIALPVAFNRVLLLFPDRLSEYDAAAHTLKTLLSASKTALGSFTGIAPKRSGGFWITGKRGRRAAPARCLEGTGD